MHLQPEKVTSTCSHRFAELDPYCPSMLEAACELTPVMADVLERMRQDSMAQQRAQRGHTLPARRSRLSLLHATALGPVLTDMYIAAGPLGDG